MLAILAVGLWGFVIGALARFAVPGPDPMPWWMTLVFGVAGGFLGAGIGYSIFGDFGALVGPVLAAMLLIIVYRRFVQRRGVTGPSARMPPGRGPGVRRRGQPQAQAPAARPVDRPAEEDFHSLLGKLGELRAAGVISDAEYEAKKTELLARS